MQDKFEAADPRTDALARAAKVLREAGFSAVALAQMFRENPARLIKLPVM